MWSEKFKKIAIPGFLVINGLLTPVRSEIQMNTAATCANTWDDLGVNYLNNNPDAWELNGYRIEVAGTYAEGNFPTSGTGSALVLPGGNKVPDFQSCGAVGTPMHKQLKTKIATCNEPDPPDEPNALACAAIVTTGDFYNSTACVVDGLGINRGDGFGGFIDSYVDNTQIQVAVPPGTWNVKGQTVSYDPASMGGPFYMMSMVAIQEYLYVDMQFMMALGASLSGAGLTVAGVSQYTSPNNTGVDINTYGSFLVTYQTAVGRLMNDFPKYFSNTNMNDLVSSVTGYPATMPNSPQQLNSAFIAAMNLWWLFDLLKEGQDLCFKQFLKEATDKGAGLKLMLGGYQIGPNAVDNGTGFNDDFATHILPILPTDPRMQAADMTPHMKPFVWGGAGDPYFNNTEYINFVFNTLNPLVAASPASTACGGTHNIYDEGITLQQVKELYFGEGGTAAAQGKGGLLWHFNINATARTGLWSALDCAFNALKGKAPTPGLGPEQISYRYDFLTILRVARQYFAGYVNKYNDRPTPSDAFSSDFSIWVTNHSQNPCTRSLQDNQWPVMRFADSEQQQGLPINATISDNSGLKSFHYSTDNDWRIWQETDENFVVPAALNPGERLWYRAADSCGNAVVEELFLIPPDPPDTVAMVVADPPGGIYVDSVSVSLTVSTDGARIFYTLDGTDPSDSETGSTLLYTGTPIHITASTTIKAWAVKTGNWVNSAVITELYTITATPPDTVALPLISPPGGSFFESVTVTITVTTSDARILYTRDGSDPSTTVGGSTLLYSGPITITDNTTIKATAVKDGNWVPGGVVTEVYVISDLPVLVKPVPIPGTSNFTSSPKFPQTIDVTFAVHPDDADIYYTLDGTDPRTSATAVLYNPGEVLTFDASTTLTAYANKEGDWTPSDTVVAVYTEIMVEDPVVALKAWIEDGNGDGEPDSIYIAFETSIPRIPDVVNDVFWPDATVVPLTVTHDAANPATSPIQLYLDDTVVLDFAQNPFGYGLTLAGEPEPTLNLPDNVLFANQKLVIEDSVGAVIMEATKVPSDQGRYGLIDTDGNITFHVNPDTLLINLSEPLVNGGDADAINTLIGKVKDCDEDNGEDILAVSFTPEVSDGGLTMKFHIEGDSPTGMLSTGDCVFLRRESSYTDAHSNRNTPVRVELGGEDLALTYIESMIFLPIIGSVSNNEEHYGTNQLAGGQIPIYNEQGEIVDYLEDPGGIDWIPPLHMDETGSIDEELNENCGTPLQSQEPRPFPVNCLSAVVVKSEGSYEARVQIYDHLGKFVHHSTQRFGKCGELENNDRVRPGGFLSFLVWNQKDDRDQYVGTGVYLWKVQYLVDGVNSGMQIFRQGIARNDENSIECESSF